MRASRGIGRVLILTLGVTLMTDLASAEEKKWDGKTFPEKLTVRKWDKQTKKFLNPKKDVPFFRGETKDGKPVFWIKSVQVATSIPTENSELTDANGQVWVVTESMQGGGNFPHYYVAVKKKP